MVRKKDSDCCHIYVFKELGLNCANMKRNFKLLSNTEAFSSLIRLKSDWQIEGIIMLLKQVHSFQFVCSS